jgi:hypothetical protein
MKFLLIIEILKVYQLHFFSKLLSKLKKIIVYNSKGEFNEPSFVSLFLSNFMHIGFEK